MCEIYMLHWLPTTQDPLFIDLHPYPGIQCFKTIKYIYTFEVHSFIFIYISKWCKCLSERFPQVTKFSWSNSSRSTESPSFYCAHSLTKGALDVKADVCIKGDRRQRVSATSASSQPSSAQDGHISRSLLHPCPPPVSNPTFLTTQLPGAIRVGLQPLDSWLTLAGSPKEWSIFSR